MEHNKFLIWQLSVSLTYRNYVATHVLLSYEILRCFQYFHIEKQIWKDCFLYGIYTLYISNVRNEYLQEPTLYTLKGIAILDNDGNRILAKYYDKNVFPTAKEQRAFEKNLYNKTHRANAEVIMLDGLTCVYRSNVDLFFYVMGSSQENEVEAWYQSWEIL